MRMNYLKQKSFIVILFLLQVIVLRAQENIPVQLEPGLLWEISGNGLKQKSYLFGTMHLMPKSDFFYPPKTLEKIKSAKTMALEIDINIPVKEQLQMAHEILLPSGKELRDYLSEKEYAVFKSFLLDTLGVSESKFEKYIKLKPFYIYSILLTEELGKVESYEKEFNKLAKKHQIKMIGLEEIKFQMDLVNQMDIREQAMSIIGVDMMQEFNAMLSIYKKQNLNELFLFMRKSTEYERMEGEMLVKRNLNWIPKIEDLIAKESSFIAVGAAHLAGSMGVINLLRQKGYTLTPVK